MKTPQPQHQAVGKWLPVPGHSQPTSCCACILHITPFVLQPAASILHLATSNLRSASASFVPHLSSHILPPAACIPQLHPVSFILHTASFILHSACSLHPASQTLHPVTAACIPCFVDHCHETVNFSPPYSSSHGGLSSSCPACPSICIPIGMWDEPRCPSLWWAHPSPCGTPCGLGHGFVHGQVAARVWVACLLFALLGWRKR